MRLFLYLAVNVHLLVNKRTLAATTAFGRGFAHPQVNSDALGPQRPCFHNNRRTGCCRADLQGPELEQGPGNYFLNSSFKAQPSAVIGNASETHLTFFLTRSHVPASSGNSGSEGKLFFRAFAYSAYFKKKEEMIEHFL